MSRLSDLIAELCPNGVEYLPLKDIFNTRNGYTPSKSNSLYWEAGTVPWFRMEDIRTNGHILFNALQYVNECAVKGELFPENSIIVATSATIGEHALITIPSLANQRFTYLMLKDKWKQKYDIKFLFYYCYKLDEWCLGHLNQSSFASVDMGQFYEFRFPVPPLEVQREIVRILDKFTELTAELTARKKQYEYYRDEQFPSIKDKNVDWVALESVATVTKLAGFEFTKYVTYSETGNIIALRGLNVKNGHLVLDDVKYVDNSDLSMLIRSKLRIGDMLFTYVGTVGQVALIDEDNKYYLAPNVALVRINGNDYLPKYMMYYFLTNKFEDEQITKLLQASSMKNIPMEKIRKFQLPMVSIEEQIKVISILDQFDGLCNDISNGLPAEVAARQKQYEYYRDKLLTFEEA